MCIQHRITSQAQRPSGRSPTKGATTRGWSESGWCSLAAFHCPTRNMDLPGSQVDDELCSLLYSGTLLKDSTEERRKLQDSALVARFSPSWPGKRPIQSIALAVDISWPATYATQWQFQSPTWVVAAAQHRILVNFWDLDLLCFSDLGISWKDTDSGRDVGSGQNSRPCNPQSDHPVCCFVDLFPSVIFIYPTFAVFSSLLLNCLGLVAHPISILVPAPKISTRVWGNYISLLAEAGERDGKKHRFLLQDLRRCGSVDTLW